jgi:hypothetical protein
MAVPKLAHWYANWAGIANDQITNAMLADDSVRGDQVLETEDFVMGTLETTGKIVSAARIVTKQGTHTGVALADLTATFGDPATLDNGSMFVYKNTTDSKTYLVVVIASVFQVEELTPVTA